MDFPFVFSIGNYHVGVLLHTSGNTSTPSLALRLGSVGVQH
jgi:hypothetical protein